MSVVLREAEAEVAVPFHDCDPLGVVWHGRYPEYFELARVAMMDAIDYGYDAMRASGYAWPVIDLRLRYLKPARFGQRIRIRAQLEEWQFRMKISYRITDVASGERLTEGSSVQVATRLDTGEMLVGSPDVLRQRLGIV
jgi:acyl-CoA thioester hydrolase